MTATTSKLGADMQKEILDKLYELRPSDNDRGRHHFERVADDIRALLARQPAAPSATCSVSEDCKWPKCRRDCVIKTDAAPLVEQDERGAISEHDAKGLEIIASWMDRDGLIEPAEFLRNLAARAASTSANVQDERGAFEVWARDEGMDLERGIIGAGAYNESSTQACWRGWKHRARAESTSANVAQDDDTATLHKLAEHLESGSSSVFSYEAGEKYARLLRGLLAHTVTANVAQGAEAVVTHSPSGASHGQ